MYKFLPAILLLIAPILTRSQPLVSFDTVVSGLSNPVDVEEVNDSSHRLFIVEQPGTIRIWNGTSLLSTPFLNVSSVISSGGERGLLSLAFHPNYSTNGYFFIYYTNPSGDVTVARYSRSTNDQADPASGVVLLHIPKRFSNHNGGNLVFGQDGYLYFGTGDGGSAGDPDNNSQNGSSLLGKMLRIDVDNLNPPYYSIPATNPFVGSTTVRQEIIATGLRNPWRWSFDRQTGDMWIADVGQDQWEEVNMVNAAARLNRNYGWSCLESTHFYKTNCATAPSNDSVVPIFEYPHNNSVGGYSITGGYMYRGSEFPSLQGYYLFADYVSANGWLTHADGNGGWTTTRQKWIGNISSFGEASDGTLYATTLTGTLYKVIAATALPVQLVSFTGGQLGNQYKINWKVQNEEAGDKYLLEKRTNTNRNFKELTRLKATENRSAGSYDFQLPFSQERTYFRLTIFSRDGQVHYSNIIETINADRRTLKAFISGSGMEVDLPAGTTDIELFDVTGKSLLQKKISTAASHINLPLNGASKGVITIRALSNNEWQSVRVVY